MSDKPITTTAETIHYTFIFSLIGLALAGVLLVLEPFNMYLCKLISP